MSPTEPQKALREVMLAQDPEFGTLSEEGQLRVAGEHLAALDAQGLVLVSKDTLERALHSTVCSVDNFTCEHVDVIFAALSEAPSEPTEP